MFKAAVSLLILTTWLRSVYKPVTPTGNGNTRAVSEEREKVHCALILTQVH